MEASEAMFSRLNQITFADLIKSGVSARKETCDEEPL
jgi:hypothetical protein